MNFIIELFHLKEYNIICIIVDKLFRERHYKLCTTNDKNILIKIIAKILIQEVFKHHNLFIFITSNRKFQFISNV